MSFEIDTLIENKLNEPDDFLKIKETLTRIGIASRKKRQIYQTCHILHKRGKYYIVHFKELFGLDGKSTTISENDISRRNSIANLLSDWELLELVDPDKSSDPVANMSQVKVIKFAEKDEWELVPKYNIGNKRINEVY